MNKKGFTLVELLAVVTILSLIMIVAVPSALNFQENMRKKMFCSKVETVEKAARLYGNDVKETIKGDKIIERKCSKILEGNSSACQYITINTLMAKGYVKKEVNNIEKGEDGKPLYNEFYDPRNFHSMKNDYVIVYIENDRAYARYVYKNLRDSEYCNPDDAEIKNTAGNTKVFGIYYEEDHSPTETHGKVSVW